MSVFGLARELFCAAGHLAAARTHAAFGAIGCDTEGRALVEAEESIEVWEPEVYDDDPMYEAASHHAEMDPYADTADGLAAATEDDGAACRGCGRLFKHTDDCPGETPTAAVCDARVNTIAGIVERHHFLDWASGPTCHCNTPMDFNAWVRHVAELVDDAIRSRTQIHGCDNPFDCDDPDCAPRQPRVVSVLGEAERDAVWRNIDGHLVYWSRALERWNQWKRPPFPLLATPRGAARTFHRSARPPRRPRRR